MLETRSQARMPVGRDGIVGLEADRYSYAKFR